MNTCRENRSTEITRDVPPGTSLRLINHMEIITEVRIDRLVYGGDAIGKLPDGRIVFIPYALPGELVQVSITDEKPHLVRAKLLEVMEPSDERISPRCPHFGLCGGCHYQHMKYPAQLKAKTRILQEQLERIGHIEEIPPILIGASPEEWYYRNYIQFHLTHTGELGFQIARTNQSFPVRECHLPEELINQIWPQIEIESHLGFARISLRSGMDDDLMLILEGTNISTLDLSIENFTPSVVQVGRFGNSVLKGSDHILIEIAGKRFKVSPTSFFQVNKGQASAIVEHCLDTLTLTADMAVLDVYAGVGLFSAFIAPRVKRLVGIELSPEACEDFISNLDEYDNVDLYEAPADQVLGSIQFKPDLILMDPPRAGLGKKTTEAVITQGAEHLVYISCDPATLARDGRLLMMGGYTLDEIQLFDMFPQTYHIESLSIWKKR
jgi:23S rRNA (uracil1939-C5)-methyltransferase